MAKETETNPKKRKLFADVSAVQVIATALAAVTSMLLSSYIGIAGSIIGVAVASIVSTLAASLYKKFLADSANKLKHLPVVGTSGETIADLIGERHKEKSGAENTAEAHTEPPKEHKGDAHEDKEEHDTPAQSHAADNQVDASTAEAHDQIKHQKTMMRGLIIVCVVSALLAVAASAAVVYLVTTGEGIGAKTSPITWVMRSDPSNTASIASTAPTPSSDNDAHANTSSSNTSASEDTNTAQTEEPTTNTSGGTEDANTTVDPTPDVPDAPPSNEALP